MDRHPRTAFNAAFTDALYQRYCARLDQQLGGPVPFRLAETPLFLPTALRHRLARAATEIVAQISAPSLIERFSDAVPPELDVPRRDAVSSCIQVDFAITRDAQGELDCKLVELQGFPSLYALTAFQLAAWREQLAQVPGLDRQWTCFFDGTTPESFVSHLRRAIVADCDPREVILMDLDPSSQKTAPDFVATKKLLDVDAVCPTHLRRDGRHLYRPLPGGGWGPVRRIYNRVVFDELQNKRTKLPFSYRDDLDVTWVPHPNWYWIWSKYTIPSVHHPSVPQTRFLSDVAELPEDLSKYVLKPLFSFAGSGVRVDVTREEIAAIPHEQRAGWLLQERIVYAPDLPMPSGDGVKAEVRMMFLRADDEPLPRLVLNLVRLSRGKMHGVDHNKDLTWVGGTVGIWATDE